VAPSLREIELAERATARPRYASSAARAAGAVAAAAGILVLLGWALGIVALTSVLPGLTKMSPLTALTFALSGAVLWLGTAPPQSPHASEIRPGAGPAWFRAASAGVALIGAYRLGDYGFGWNLNVDQLGLGGPHPAGGGALSLMAPATAFGFLLLGAALLLSRGARLFGVFQALCLLVAMTGWLGISHYIYGGEPLLPYTKMALHTAILFLILSAGILCTRTDRGLVALLMGQSAGGVIARRLVPAAVFAPAVLGWLRLEGQRAGLFDTEAGVSLFALSNIMVFGALIWDTAQSLHRSDVERMAARRKLQSQLERLKLLEQITHAIGERQDLLSIFQVVVRSLEDQLPVDLACACRYDAPSNLLLVTSVGLRSQALVTERAPIEPAQLAIEENGLWRCMRGEFLYEPDLRSLDLPLSQRLASAGLRSLVIAPLCTEGKVFGILLLARRQPAGFSSADCEFLRQLSEHTALAANQVQLYSELQTAYEDLRRTQQVVMQHERLRVLGQMASGVAHDINNALSPVALYTESLLAHEPGLSERARGYLQTIRQAIDDVAQTIGRMRQLYRPGEPESELLALQLNGLVRQVVDLTRSRWSDMPRQHGVDVRLQTDLAADLPLVSGIESEIRDSLVNLIFNAVDAMPKGGTLSIRTRILPACADAAPALPRARVGIEVSDTGTGMDDATRARCLEPFFTTKGERGTGLGLAMVYGMVQRHGATIDIESEPGRGTTICLAFPVPASQVQDPRVVRIAPKQPSRLRILLVDDDPLLLQSLRDTLQSEGHTVAAASGGQAGIDLFNLRSRGDEPFAVVITDLGMPDVDGRKVAAAVKAASAATPVIMLTGWGRRMTAEDSPANIDCLLSKPPKLSELREALSRCAAGAGAALQFAIADR